MKKEAPIAWKDSRRVHCSGSVGETTVGPGKKKGNAKKNNGRRIADSRRRAGGGPARKVEK